MRFQHFLLVVGLLGPIGTGYASVPIENFAKSSEFFDLKLSPGGDYLGVKTSHEGKVKLLILDSNTLQPTYAVAFPQNGQVGNYTWVNDDRVVIEKQYIKAWNEAPIYYGELMAVNANGSQSAYIFGYDGGAQQTGSHLKKNTPIRATAFILDPLVNDKRSMLVNALSWDDSEKNLAWEKVQDIYKVDVYRGTRTRITGTPIGNPQLLTDNEGEVRFASGVDKDARLNVYYRKGGEWINTEKFNFGLEQFRPLSFADTPNSIYALGAESDGPIAIYRLDLETGDKKKIMQDPKLDPNPEGFWINNQNKQLYAIEYSDGYPTYAFIDANDKRAKLLKSLIEALPGHQVQLVSETRKADRFIVRAFNDRNPGDYYLYDAENNKLRYLLSDNQSLDPEQMAEVKPFKITSRDGLELQAYLTLPKGKDPKNLPLVVAPHGGPALRDFWEFNPTNQLLASHGIAVLQVNFRGSGGYGTAFEAAGYGKWGSDIQNDIIDATRQVIANGMADKDRVCIVGTSFGGYSALQSSILAPDLFKCAVGVAGVYDLEMMFEEGDIQTRASGRAYLQDVLPKDKFTQQAMSPVHNVDKLRAKLLLIHGDNDERVPVEQLVALEKALKSHNYPYQKLIMDNEGHNFYNDNNKAKYYSELLSFLKTNLQL
ncbi:alpha/beta hydrolase family protein [Shewanella sedimentimangrovi]|uniref:S9 family peptidase n=1 Tax=Shewanella sedimentimangrovi TaxID=2814293 RepID=A0ABX7R3B0_9GAMM|nr:S9 family peptidase [Shewanella sedimentimangrovi]QSX37573.1 S9 family peptidase [Shewanella sedimentimangrovi]